MSELDSIIRELDQISKREKILKAQLENYFKGKIFKIVKNIYYSGYQNNLKDRLCILKPAIVDNKVLASCIVYNKRTNQIDIIHDYLHPLDYYEEVK